MQSLRQKFKKKTHCHARLGLYGEGMKCRNKKKTNEQNLALYVSTPLIMVFTPNMRVFF